MIIDEWLILSYTSGGSAAICSCFLEHTRRCFQHEWQPCAVLCLQVITNRCFLQDWNCIPFFTWINLQQPSTSTGRSGLKTALLKTHYMHKATSSLSKLCFIFKLPAFLIGTLRHSSTANTQSSSVSAYYNSASAGERMSKLNRSFLCSLLIKPRGKFTLFFIINCRAEQERGGRMGE